MEKESSGKDFIWKTMSDDELDELEKMCAPLVEYLQTKCNQHSWIIVQWEGVAFIQDSAWLPFSIRD